MDWSLLVAFMGGNYPPGVTGSEYAIAGADYEQPIDTLCPDCGSSVTEQGYRHARWITCNECPYIKDIKED